MSKWSASKSLLSVALRGGAGSVHVLCTVLAGQLLILTQRMLVQVSTMVVPSR